MAEFFEPAWNRLLNGKGGQFRKTFEALARQGDELDAAKVEMKMSFVEDGEEPASDQWLPQVVFRVVKPGELETD